jgi:hypothetical protein
MSHQEQLELIKKFSPITAKHYFTENGMYCYFGVILRDGLIDVETYPSGRIYAGYLKKNEHFICFRKMITKDNNVKLYLREKLNEKNLSNSDLDLYLYIKENCGFEPY